MNSSGADEGIVGAHHIGIGLPSEAAYKELVTFLVTRGAFIVEGGPTKTFLKLNPEDTLLLELFLTDGEMEAHIDYTVADLKQVQEMHPTLHDYGIPDMLFLDLPGVDSSENIPVQIAFTNRDE